VGRWVRVFREGNEENGEEGCGRRRGDWKGEGGDGK